MLRIKGLTRYFGGLGAVVDLNLDVHQGEIVGLIGPNGAGKSTVMNMITGTLRPSSGRMIFRGEDITRLPGHAIARKGIARVFQANTLFQNLPVVTNVRIGLHLHSGIRFWGAFLSLPYVHRREEHLRTEAYEILRFAGLSGLEEQQAVNLPHGNQRVLCLAVALAVKPALLLLDEPMTGMNADEVNTMLALIRALRAERGVTVIMVEHNMQAVMGLCDRIAVLNYGQKIAEGSPGEISENQKVIEAYLGVEQDAT
jgi:branched-chain amino acid transport system ATP-binding protein